MKNKTPLFILIATIIFSLFLVLGNQKAYAQTPLELQVSPPIIEVTIDPGDTYSDFIKFQNLSDIDTLELYPLMLSFVAKGEEGGQEFIEDSEETTNFSLAQWINISTDKVFIEPLERIVLPFTITVPVDAEPGGRYGAVLLGNQPLVPEGGSNVALGARTGTIILAKISGDVTESAILTEYRVGKDSYQYPPVDFSIRIENVGNIHVKPEGEIEIKNIFGKSVDRVLVNEAGGNVLPESIRKFTPSWERDKFTIGKFTAALSLEYGVDNPMELSETISFWVLPLKEIIIVVVALILVVILFFVLVKTYNKLIVKKAIKKQQKTGSQNTPPTGVPQA